MIRPRKWDDKIIFIINKLINKKRKYINFLIYQINENIKFKHKFSSIIQNKNSAIGYRGF